LTELSDVSLIVLGAGLSQRFGGDKLSAELDGRAVALHLLDQTSGVAFAEKVVVARGQDWTAEYRSAGFRVVENSAPGLGLSSSLRLGLAACEGQNILICLADMPNVTAGHLQTLARVHDGREVRIVASRSPAFRGPPAILSRSEFDRLPLEGDRGARDLLAEAQWVDVDPAVLADIDTPEHLSGATNKRSQPEN
jgi:CTP:molybdopterin cytidylyltransferase MocA